MIILFLSQLLQQKLIVDCKGKIHTMLSTKPHDLTHWADIHVRVYRICSSSFSVFISQCEIMTIELVAFSHEDGRLTCHSFSLIPHERMKFAAIQATNLLYSFQTIGDFKEKEANY